MPTKIETKAIEGSTFAVDVTFFKDSGEEVTPKTLQWTLTDPKGTVINSREDVVIAPSSSTETIVLSGDDLELVNDVSEERHLKIDATYDSDIGSDLPLVDSLIFEVSNTVYPNKDD